MSVPKVKESDVGRARSESSIELEADEAIDTLPGDDRFYFPASKIDNGRITFGTWEMTLDVSLPVADLVGLMERLGELPKLTDPPMDMYFVLHGIVRFDDLISYLGDKVTWHRNRGFVRKESWPDAAWIKAYALDAESRQAVGIYGIVDDDQERLS